VSEEVLRESRSIPPEGLGSCNSPTETRDAGAETAPTAADRAAVLPAASAALVTALVAAEVEGSALDPATRAVLAGLATVADYNAWTHTPRVRR
jgi:hypothetical protein